jgi:hypothetical protein
MCHQQNTRTASPSGYCVEGLSIPSMTLCPVEAEACLMPSGPRSGAWLASDGTRRRQGDTPPAEVHLRYIYALTSRYAGRRSQRERGRTRADAGRRRTGSGWPGDGATWQYGAGRRGTAPRRLGAANNSTAFSTDVGTRRRRADTSRTRSPRRPRTTLNGALQAETRRQRGPSVAVRGNADGAHRPPLPTVLTVRTDRRNCAHQPF